jgi:hypothetical protein
MEVKFLNNICLHINEDTAHNKVTSYTKIIELKILSKFLYKTKYKQDNQVKKTVKSFEDEG